MAKEVRPRLALSGLKAQAIVEQFNKRYGVNTLIRASKAVGLKIRFIATGVAAVDFGLGGGIPKNRISEIRGPYSAGKSTLAYTSMAEFQREDPNNLCAMIDLERAYDPAYAGFRGVDNDRVLLVSADSGEQAVDVINDLTGVSVNLFIVGDSLAALTPSAEIEGSMDDQFMGLQARLVNRAMRVATARMKASMYDDRAASTTVLWLNQLREKIGVMFGNPETTPGGKGKDFAYSMRMRISAPPSKRIVKDVEKNGVTRKIHYGSVHEVTIDKNKCTASQFDEATFESYRRPYKHYGAGEFDNDSAIYRMARFYGILAEKNGKLVCHSLLPGMAFSAQEKRGIEALHGQPRAMRILRSEVLREIQAEGKGENEEGSEIDDEMPKAKITIRKAA